MPTGETLDVLLKISYVVIPLLVTFAGWAIVRYVRMNHLQIEHEKLLREKEEIVGKLNESREQAERARLASADRYDKLRADYHDAYGKFYQLKSLAHRLKQERDNLRRRSTGVPRSPNPSPPENPSKIAELTAKLDAANAELLENQRRIEEATKSDGRIWLRPPIGQIPEFKPRDERRNVIISVLNFKGGVGKTTITANLAATLAKTDPSLLIDLDYQRSLSMLLVPNKDRILLHRAGHSVQHFLIGADHSAAKLISKLQSLSPDLPDCALLPNSDSRSNSDGDNGLEETESRLMIEWLFDRNKPDPRFFLREALHDRAIQNEFRYVFLDCPPRLTTACVSALAASDYVLIPVLPDAVSTRAAENLLTTLRGLRNLLNPELKVLAVAPNMVKPHGEGLIKAHQDALIELKNALLQRWDEPVLIAQSGIRQDMKFGLAVAQLDTNKKLRLAIKEPAIAECFDGLAQELLKEIQPHASRRPSAVPSQSGARTRSGR